MSGARQRDGRAQSMGEEIANAASHGVAALAGLAGMPLLLMAALRAGGAAALAGAAVFASAVVLLYVASVLYHALPAGRAKRVFRLLDHDAIFLLIAGTYTPFTLRLLPAPWGWTLFALAWFLAVSGIALRSLAAPRFERLALGWYLAMGWLAAVALGPLWSLLPGTGFALLVAGGVAYTAGVAFYVTDARPYHHFVWHLFVVAGTACHYLAVMWYAP